MFDEARADKLERLVQLSQETGDIETEIAAMREMKKMKNDLQLKIDPTFFDKMNNAISSNPIGATIAEGAAAVNRGATQLADMVTTQPANAVLELAGSDMRIPSITKSLSSATGGGFMEVGMPRDIVRAAGEVVPGAVAGGMLFRSAAQQLPAVTGAAESIGTTLLRSAGSGSAAADAAYGAVSGAGGVAGREAGGYAGEVIGGEDGIAAGRQIGSFVGSVAAPLAASATIAAPKLLAAQKEKALIKEAAPTIDRLKESAREVYKEIDDLGAVVDAGRVTGLVRDLNVSIKGEGFNRRIHPKVSAALDEISSAAGKNQKVTNLDTLRKVARSAAASIEPDEARLGNMMVSKIDDFMDNIDQSALVGGNAGNIGEKYRHARQLWQRARKAEDIEYIFDKAKNQASGFENGLRTQFRTLLNNKKKIKGYSAEEVEAIQKVVRGGGAENIAKAIGKLGFTEGQATSMLLGSLGVAGGFAIGGSAGGVAVPLIGQVSKNLAQKLTRNNAEFASQLVRSGRNSTAITKQYIAMVPAAQRSSLDLAELLITMNATSQITFSPRSEQLKRFVSDAAYLVGAAKSQNNDNEETK